MTFFPRLDPLLVQLVAGLLDHAFGNWDFPAARVYYGAVVGFRLCTGLIGVLLVRAAHYGFLHQVFALSAGDLC